MTFFNWENMLCECVNCVCAYILHHLDPFWFVHLALCKTETIKLSNKLKMPHPFWRTSGVNVTISTAITIHTVTACMFMECDGLEETQKMIEISKRRGCLYKPALANGIGRLSKLFILTDLNLRLSLLVFIKEKPKLSVHTHTHTSFVAHFFGWFFQRSCALLTGKLFCFTSCGYLTIRKLPLNQPAWGYMAKT